jgi:hypothetical protein
VGAVWLGAMAYSLAVVQPRAARFFADRARDRERFALELAAVARRRSFTRSAAVLTAIVALEFVLGAAAAEVG